MSIEGIIPPGKISADELDVRLEEKTGQHSASARGQRGEQAIGKRERLPLDEAAMGAVQRERIKIRVGEKTNVTEPLSKEERKKKVEEAAAAQRKEIIKATLNESFPNFFERSLESGDVYGAFLQLDNGFRYQLSAYQEKKKKFLDYVDKLLAESMSEAVEKYRQTLETLKSNVEADAYEEVIGETQISTAELIDEAPADEKKKMHSEYEEARKEIFSVAFDNAISQRNFEGAAIQLAQIKEEYGGADYDKVKQVFLKELNEELAKDELSMYESAKKRLETLKKAVLLDDYS
ncbi:hypothetical protein KKC32_03195 [Patescibacteria group bacterium]|nr:hypothetical protein [Patescibacteria group bacterium]